MGAVAKHYSAHQNTQVLISETCEGTTLHREGDFADVLKLRILRWGVHPGSPGLAQCGHKWSDKEAGRSVVTVGGVMMEERGWRDTGSEQGRGAGGLQKLKEARKRTLP